MNWWPRYARFWSEREAPEALALLRITFALALIGNLLEQTIMGQVLEYYASPDQGGIFPVEPPDSPLSLFRWLPPSASTVLLLVIVQLVAANLLLVGLFTRLAALVCWVIQITLFDRMWLFGFGGDNVFRVGLYLMVLSPVGAAWSIDAWWRGKGPVDVPCWCRRLFLFQLTVIYVTTGIMKAGSTWSILGNWSALYLAVNLPGLARWSGDWAAWVFPLTQIGTFVSKWWEITFFVAPWNLYLRRPPRRPAGNRVLRLLACWDLRLLYLLTGVLFHVGLILLFDLGVFSVVMLSLYPSLLRPEEARTIGCRLGLCKKTS